MKKNEQTAARRKDFIKISLNDHKTAATQLHVYAKELGKSKTTTERVKILSELLCLSEATIFREFADN